MVEKYYEILGLDVGASLNEAKERYNYLIEELNPKKQEDDLKGFFKEEQDNITKAYNKVLENIIALKEEEEEAVIVIEKEKKSNLDVSEIDKESVNKKVVKSPKKFLQIIIFVIIAFVFVGWAGAMTASGPDTLKFYLIYIPLIIFLISEFYFISKIRTSSKNKKTFKLLSFFISPIILFIFLFFSFGQRTNKICVSGDCENGYGEALYISSERTTKSGNEYNDGELHYYKPEILGRNWYNNIVWYDGNPIKYVYRGEFKNGYFHGEGSYFWFTYDYDAEPFHYKYPIDGIYLVAGEWERGWLFWDRESRVSGGFNMNDEIKQLMKKYKLDERGFYQGE